MTARNRAAVVICSLASLAAVNGRSAGTTSNGAAQTPPERPFKIAWTPDERSDKAGHPTDAAPFDPKYALDDKEFDRHMCSRMLAHYREGRAVSVSNLIAQLSRKKYALQLPNEATPRPPMTAAEVYRHRMNSVLVIGCLRKEEADFGYRTAASGFVLHSSGIVVTSYHVVDAPGWSGLFAMNRRGQVFPVTEVLAADKATDLAIMRVEGTGLTPAWLSSEAAVGDAAYCISNLAHNFYMLTSGMVARYFNVAKSGTGYRAMLVTADTAWGSSGAPVFDNCGGVIGIATANLKIRDDDHPGQRGEIQKVYSVCTPVRALRDLLGAQPESRPAPDARPTRANGGIQ